ncbi:MAG: D-arabinono-1,4-lactone oxidase [Hyphomonadaceae bacterium]
MQDWSNWSGSVTARPAVYATPKTEAELSALVARAEAVRVAGAGHSFMPLCATDGVLVSLAAMEGAPRIDRARHRVRAPAGWSLAKLTAALWAEGLSLINQGDVNPQALAGAIATGTHGTGAALGSLSTAARAFRLVLADGAIVTCSAEERPELFEAARLSLGLLGVVTEIEIDVMAAYHLEERIEAWPLDAVAEQWSALTAQNRHAEFWVFPYSERAILKRLNPAPAEGELKQTTDLDDRAFGVICDMCAAAPFVTPALQRLIVPANVKQRRVGPAYRIFASERNVRFEEMEYQLPLDAGWPALRAAIAHVRRKRLPLTFPFEFRIVAGDDIWLSPFNGAPRLSISTHQYKRMPWQGVFAELEPIFRDHGGRPHWAKRHNLAPADVDALYPGAARFRAVRAAHDPGAKFANAHLGALFGLEAKREAA